MTRGKKQPDGTKTALAELEKIYPRIKRVRELSMSLQQAEASGGSVSSTARELWALAEHLYGDLQHLARRLREGDFADALALDGLRVKISEAEELFTGEQQNHIRTAREKEKLRQELAVAQRHLARFNVAEKTAVDHWRRRAVALQAALKAALATLEVEGQNSGVCCDDGD